MDPFLDSPRFPDCVAYGSRGGPEFSTRIIALDSGHEHRNAAWAQGRHRYQAEKGLRTLADLEEVIALHHVARGRATGFRYKDHLDYRSGAVGSAPTATDVVLATGDGTTTAFNLFKLYRHGTTARQRRITHPVSGSILIALDTVVQGSGWSWNATTYQIDFTTAPGNGVSITAGFEFDVPVRFDTDTLEISLEAYELGQASIPLIEIRIV